MDKMNLINQSNTDQNTALVCVWPAGRAQSQDCISSRRSPYHTPVDGPGAVADQTSSRRAE